jgi:hypothetical protein
MLSMLSMLAVDDGVERDERELLVVSQVYLVD